MLDVINNEGNTERHMGWFRSIEVKSGRGGAGPSVLMPGALQGDEMRRVGNLHEDVENGPFFGDIRGKVNPSGQVGRDAGREPPEKVTFVLSMTFKPPAQWVKNQSGN